MERTGVAVALRSDLVTALDEPAPRGLVANDLGVVRDVGDGGDRLGEREEVLVAAGLRELVSVDEVRAQSDEIDRLIREAEEFADSDKSTKELLVLKTKVDSLLKNTKKSFNKFGGLLPELDQEGAESVFKEAEAASKTEKVEEIKIALNKLERLAGQLTSAMLESTSDATTEV